MAGSILEEEFGSNSDLCAVPLAPPRLCLSEEEPQLFKLDPVVLRPGTLCCQALMTCYFPSHIAICKLLWLHSLQRKNLPLAR